MRLLSICLLAPILACLLGAMAGCSTTKTITISSKPPGAAIDIDDVRQTKNPITVQLTWNNENDVRYVRASKAGYRDQIEPLKIDYDRGTLELKLKPQSKKFTVNVQPVGAIVSLNGTPINTEPASLINAGEREFTIDPKTGAWTKYTITAERHGYKTATGYATWEDNQTTYTLALAPMDKEFTVNTSPDRAQIYFDNELVGTSPTEKITRVFNYDVKTDSYEPHRIRASLTGYPDREIPEVSPDDGKSEYQINFVAANKTIHLRTTPPGGVVTLEGKEYKPDANGDVSIPLSFPPTNEKGELKVYKGKIEKPKTGTSEWYPQPINIGWENNKTDYNFAMREIRTVPLALRTVSITRGLNGWETELKTEQTIAGKDVGEPGRVQVVSLTPVEARGQTIDGLAVSPDGKRLLYTVLMERPQSADRPYSLMYTLRTDGSEPPQLMNDGRSLDVTPSFSPDGERILYASDRSGNRLTICSMSALGGRSIEQYLSKTIDIWPSMDSSPNTRIFHQGFSDLGDKPSIYSFPLDGNQWNDLKLAGGMQPRINAQNDTLVYCAANEQTRKRDIFRVGDRGGAPTNLTNSSDEDDYDATWDRVGARIAFASDRGVDEEKRHNFDIWVLDLSQPNAAPKQITSNASQDDHPVWDPSGRAIYFRSNRGGEWGIWKVMLK